MKYTTEILKNGAKVHTREWTNEAAALRAAQALANAARVTVRVIDRNRADGVTLVRPA